MAAAAILDFQNFIFLMVGWLKRVEVCCHAKFGRNQSNCGRDMAIFRFSMMAAAAIEDFKIFESLIVEMLKRVKQCQFIKFRRNRSNHGQNMANFQGGGRRHLGFSKF